jgi:glutaredoxin
VRAAADVLRITGRLAPRRGRPTTVTFVTRAGCHLCDVAEPIVRRVAAQAGVEVTVVDVDVDAAARAAWSDKVPVVLLDGREHAYWSVDEKALRRALRARV